MYKLVMTEKVMHDEKAILMNRKTRKKKRVYLHNENELNYWMAKK